MLKPKKPNNNPIHDTESEEEEEDEEEVEDISDEDVEEEEEEDEEDEEEEESEEESEEEIPIVAKLPIAKLPNSQKIVKSVPEAIIQKSTPKRSNFQTRDQKPTKTYQNVPAKTKERDSEYESEDDDEEEEDEDEDEDDEEEKVSVLEKIPEKRGKMGTSDKGKEDSPAKTTNGRPVQIIKFKENHVFELDEEALESILLQDHVKDRYIVVVSVAGAFRKGKSFLLDFFLRYMKSKYVLHQGDGDWMGPDDVPLEGFSWRGGSERDTTGILLWSEVFLVDLPSGDKVGVVLMDTQGAFDSESTVRDCATVFALSTMISSLQIYNLSHNIQEDDLQHLQLFTEYGRLALDDIGEKPFQKLQFLVRDWSFPYDADYGAAGGKKILTRRLAISDKQHPELQSLRKHINSCFMDISCFLMPHPGLNVATSRNFDGRLSHIENDFKKCLSALVPMLLAPENLVIKQISGQKVKAKELLQYFKSYINMYKGNELPEPKSMLMATAEANNLAAVASAKETYQQLMEEVCGGTKPYMSTDRLVAEHLRIKDKSIIQFNAKRKMGGEEFSEQYRGKLEEDLEELFQQYRAHNESKNIFKAAKTPAVFFAMAVIFYVLSGIFGLFGMYTFANLCNFVMGTALLVLITWAYIRYSGEFTEIGRTLDGFAVVIWDGGMKPVYQQFIEKSLERAAINAATSAASELANSSLANGKPKSL